MILAIDTATRMISLALFSPEEGLREERTWSSPNRHTVELAPAVQHLLGHQGVSIGDLSALAVAQGPGSYTGLRIGMSFAKGLALGRSPALPIVAIPTLDIVAAAQPLTEERLLAVIHAGRSRISVGFYQSDGQRWQPDGEPRNTTWENLLADITQITRVVGEVDKAVIPLIAPHKYVKLARSAAGRLRRAGFLAELAHERLNDAEDPASVVPTYLR
ncbi:MAG: tRNA (adenosine(37)-N6)-threonylcarbamoyltransferase complex dimerization subunit type 1 TsaB [Chloroflexi bacterium]|nr:tRNA (adenosine(37)-N6)-threonylcarbamoyltransferase complex dimerization subunit type 1 TsaB [Chloroflexota bacterium]